MAIVEHILRLRDDASGTLQKAAKGARTAALELKDLSKASASVEDEMQDAADAARQLEREFKQQEKATNKLRGVMGGSGLVNDLGDVAEGIEKIGVGGAALTVGLGAITTAAYALTSGVIEVIKNVDELAPRFKDLAGMEVISADGIESAHEITTNMDRLKDSTLGLAGVFVNSWGPAIDNVTGKLADFAQTLLRVYVGVSGFSSGMFEELGKGFDPLKAFKMMHAGFEGAIDATSNTGPDAGLGIRGYQEAGAGGDFSSLMDGNKKIQDKKAAAAKRAGDAAKRIALTGPSASGMAQIDVSDVLDDVANTTLTVIQQQIESAMNAAPTTNSMVTDSMAALQESIAGYTFGAVDEAAKAAAKAQKMDKAIGGVNLATSIAGGGVGAISGALSSSDDKGMQLAGGIVGLADLIRTQGAEGVREQAESIMTLVPELLAELPEILASVIPALITEGLPAMITGIFNALPKILKAFLIDLPVALFKGIMLWFKTAWQNIKDLFSFGDADKKAARQADRAARRAARRAGGDDYRDTGGETVRALENSQARRSGGGSTGRAGGGTTVVNVGSLIGTDAKAARSIAKTLNAHLGSRGTGLNLGGG